MPQIRGRCSGEHKQTQFDLQHSVGGSGETLICVMTKTAWQSFLSPKCRLLWICWEVSLFAESSKVKCVSHHSTAAGEQGTICQFSWREGGGKAPYSHFSKEDETGKHNIQKTLVIPISVSSPGLERMLGSIWTKKGFLPGEKTREQKVGSHGLVNKTNYLKLGLLQKIWDIWLQTCANKISHSKISPNSNRYILPGQS